ncbi:GNAT family N-acetyltransferase [Streptomyces antnestii]|uniref:GNAT family N-acetyltransferase n=1 Tax=Streptomyces antnestii TaxID=2494256 RepID=A0A3S2VL73_9ACTN|nr:GNAT family N-acetyltransferase [Streptomyces sp. San01]RVU15399.1 GNAT family N-acetyltransferase [Streptomyces sp. San01]
MPQLIAPDVRVHSSFLAAMDEARAEGHGGPDDSTAGLSLRAYGDTWQDPAVFAEYVARLRLTHGPRSILDYDVPCTTLWYVDGDTYLGRLAIRHTLTEAWLRDGHIGYDVRPGARRRGHATAMLRAALPLAARLGVDPALITCDTGNTASRRVIEACGGVRDDAAGDDGVLRYRAPTAHGSHTGRTLPTVGKE